MAAPQVPYTWTFAVDNVGNPEPIIAPTACRKIIVRELATVATAQQWNYHSPLSSSPAYALNAAEAHEIEAQNYLQFEEGQIVGYADTSTGATMFTGLAIP